MDNLCWIQTCIGVHGSVGVGGAAGSAIQFGVVKFRIPYIDMEYFVELYIDSLWRIWWTFVMRVNFAPLKLSGMAMLLRSWACRRYCFPGSCGSFPIDSFVSSEGGRRLGCAFCGSSLAVRHVFWSVPAPFACKTCFLEICGQCRGFLRVLTFTLFCGF